MTDESREKLESLRREDERFTRQLDEMIRAVPPHPDSWTDIEGDQIRLLFHLMLGAVNNLSERVTNLEEMLLWASEEQRAEALQPRLGAYRTSEDRAEDGFGAAILGTEYDVIARLANGTGPVTEVDRANIALELKRLLDRYV